MLTFLVRKRMFVKWHFVLSLFIGLILYLPQQVFSEKVGDFDLVFCSDDELHVRFLCSPQWTIRTDQDALLMILREDPAVLLTVTKDETDFIFVDQLNDEILMQFGQYQPGFKRGQTYINNQEFLIVDAGAEGLSQIKLRDYYVISRGYLYSFMFSVDPSNHWDQYEKLIDHIAQSIEIRPLKGVEYDIE